VGALRKAKHWAQRPDMRKQGFNGKLSRKFVRPL